MEKPFVSVIIPTYNRQEYIEKALASVISQTYQNIEIVVIDDGSEDETPEIISGLKKKESKIISLTNKTNLGFVKSLNKGIEKSHGKYIARLDDDDLWLSPKKLEKQVDFLEKNPDYVLVGGGMIKIDKNNKEIGRYLFPEKDKDIRKVILINNVFVHSSVLFRKDVFDRAGGYNKELGFFSDFGLWLKMGKLGKFYNFPEHFVSYFQDKEKHRDSKIRRRLITNLKLRRKYSRDYPNFGKAFFFCFTAYLYSFLPFRKKLQHFYLKLRNLIFGKDVS